MRRPICCILCMASNKEHNAYFLKVVLHCQLRSKTDYIVVLSFPITRNVSKVLISHALNIWRISWLALLAPNHPSIQYMVRLNGIVVFIGEFLCSIWLFFAVVGFKFFLSRYKWSLKSSLESCWCLSLVLAAAAAVTRFSHIGDRDPWGVVSWITSSGIAFWGLFQLRVVRFLRLYLPILFGISPFETFFSETFLGGIHLSVCYCCPFSQRILPYDKPDRPM